MSNNNPKALKRKIVSLAGKFRREIWAIGIFSAVINLLMLSPTLYMLQVFDRVMISRSELTLLVLTLFVLLFYAVQAFCEWMRSKLMIGSGLRLDAELSVPVFRAMFRDQITGSGSAPVQAFTDMTVIRHWLTGAGAFAFFDLPWSPIYLAVMFMLHPILGWLTIAFMVILALFAWWTTRATRDASEAAEDEERELNAFIHSKLRNAEVIEALGMVPNLFKRWWHRQVQTLGVQAQSHATEQRFTVSSKELRALMQSLALGAGALLAIQGDISFGAMIAASLLMGRATSPIDQIVAGWRSFMSVRQSFSRLESLLSKDVEDGTITVQSPQQMDVRVQNLTATARGRKELILQAITADFPAGQIYAVMGNSGAGKSTFGKAILGIWPEVDGRVLLNGQPVHLLDRQSIGQHLGYLPQDIELFSGTVAENIARMAEPDSEKVIEAARITGTHDMILRLPKGYDSPIGEGGAALSGGQRQRVALARALYGSPRLIVLDEPNANLDEAGEAALVQALQQVRQRGCTIFLITHRPGIVRIADRVVFMANGLIDLYGETRTVMQTLATRARASAASRQAPASAQVYRNSPPGATANA